LTKIKKKQGSTISSNQPEQKVISRARKNKKRKRSRVESRAQNQGATKTAVLEGAIREGKLKERGIKIGRPNCEYM